MNLIKETMESYNVQNIVYYFLNKNNIRKALLFVFVGNVPNDVFTILEKYNSISREKIKYEILNKEKDALKKYFGSNWLKILFPKFKSKKQFITKGGSKNSVLELLKEKKNNKTNSIEKNKLNDEDMLNSYDEQSLASMIHEKRIFIKCKSLEIYDNLETLKQFIYYYLSEYSEATLWPDTQFLFQIPNKLKHVTSGEREIQNNELASNELASNELASNELASNELASNELASNELASNELETNALSHDESTIHLYDINKEMNNLKNLKWENNTVHDDKLLNIFKGVSPFIFVTDLATEIRQIKYSNDTLIKESYIKYYRYLYPKIDENMFMIMFNSEEKKDLNLDKTLTERIRKDHEMRDLINQIKDDKVYREIKKRGLSYNVTQCMAHVHINQNYDLEQIFDKIKTSKMYPYIKLTTSKQINDTYIYYERVSKRSKFSKRNGQLIQKWKEKNNNSNSILIKILTKNNLDANRKRNIDDNEQGKFHTFIINRTKNNGTEFKLNLSFSKEMKITKDDIYEQLQLVSKILNKISKESNIIMPNVYYSKRHILNKNKKQNAIYIDKIYNLNGSIVFWDLENDFNYNNLQSCIINLPLFFEPINNNNQKILNTFIYKLINYYESGKQERIHKYIEQEVSKTGKSSNRQIEVITQTTGLDKNNVIKIYNKLLKRNVSINPTVVPEYIPNGIKLSIVKGINQIQFKGIKEIYELTNLLESMTILISLYKNIYDLKNTKFKLKNNLQTKSSNSLKKNTSRKIIKQLGYFDHARFSWKAKKHEKNYGRLCQNNRPNIIDDEKKEDFLKMGWVWDNELNTYTYMIEKMERKRKGEAKMLKHLLKAVRFKNFETGKYYWYYCDPKSVFPFVGFLDKSHHPEGLCMPCCFKTPQENSNKKKRNLYNSCKNTTSHQSPIIDNIDTNKDIYILSSGKGGGKILDVNQISFLPPYLDILLNKLQFMDQTKRSTIQPLPTEGISKLQKANKYYVKLGTRSQKSDQYNLNAVLSILSMEIDGFKDHVIKQIRNKKMYVQIMEGKLYNNFKDIDYCIDNILLNAKYEFIWNNENFLFSLLSTPGIFNKSGYNIGFFTNKYGKPEQYYLEFIITNNWNDPNRSCLLFIQDNYIASKYIYPIVRINKTNKNDQHILIKESLTSENFLMKKIYDLNFNHLNNKFYSKKISYVVHKILSSISTKYEIVGQILTNNYILKYLVLRINEDLIPIPVLGYQSILYNYPIYSYENEIKEETNVDFVENNIKYIKLEKLVKLYNQLDRDTLKELGMNVQRLVSFDKQIIGVKLQNTEIIYCEPIKISSLPPKSSILKKLIKKILVLKIDKETFNNELNKKSEIYNDEVITSYNKNRFFKKHYLHFQLHISSFFKKPRNLSYKKEILEQLKIADKIEINEDRDKKIMELKEFFKIVKPKLNLKNKSIKVEETYKNTSGNFVNQCGLSGDTCEKNPHCYVSKEENKCYLNISNEDYSSFSNKLIYEIIFNKLKRKEIFNMNGAFLSNRIGKEVSFGQNPKEILDSNINKMNPFDDIDLDFLNSINSLTFNVNNKSENIKTFNNQFNIISIQNHDNLYIFRALANSIFEESLKESNYDIETYYAFKLLSIVAKQLLKNDKLKSYVDEYTSFNSSLNYMYHIYQNSGSYIPELVALSLDASIYNTPIYLLNKDFETEMKILNGNIYNKPTLSTQDYGKGIWIRYRSEYKHQQIHENCLEIQTIFPKDINNTVKITN